MTLPFNLEIEANIEDDDWREAVPDLERLYREVATWALENIVMRNQIQFDGPADAAVEISLLFSCDDTIQRLNKNYRDQDKATNVLSFPDTRITAAALDESLVLGEAVILGDIILARETVFAEAKTERKSIADHLSHLLVHGILHLAGYDHIEDDEAQIMESFEIEILSGLNISNPYALLPPLAPTDGSAPDER